MRTVSLKYTQNLITRAHFCCQCSLWAAIDTGKHPPQAVFQAWKKQSHTEAMAADTREYGGEIMAKYYYIHAEVDIHSTIATS